MERSGGRNRLWWPACACGFVLAVGVLVAAPVSASGQSPSTALPSPGAHVTGDLARVASGNGRLYAAGFRWIAPFSGSLLALDAGGAIDPSFPIVDGQVSEAAPDGRGGFYIGGDFSSVGGVPRRFLARITARGGVDAAFAPQIDGFVADVAVAGDRVIIGGHFSRAGQLRREGIASLDAATGVVDGGFDHGMRGSAAELALGGGRLYAAGSLRAAGEASATTAVVVLDPRSGQRLGEIRGRRGSTGSQVRALALADGRLYVGTEPNGRDRTVTAYDAVSGAPTGPRFDLRGRVDELLFDSGRLIAAGDLYESPTVAPAAVALDLATGARDPRFRCAALGAAVDLLRVGDSLWLAGGLDLDRTPGYVRAIDPQSCAQRRGVLVAPEGRVNALAAGAGRVLAGGRFSAVNGVRAQLAALDPATGAPAGDFVRQALPAPTAITAGSGHVWVASGRHVTQFDGRSGRRERVVALPRGLYVRELASVDDAVVVLDESGRHIAVFDATSGARRRFTVPLPGPVFAILGAGARLYLAGSFKRRRADGRPANLAVLKVDPRTGRLDAGFDPHVNGPVERLALRGRWLYLAGLFTRAEPVVRHGLARVDVLTGQVDRAFAPRFPGAAASRLALHGADLLLGGDRLYVVPECFRCEPRAAFDLRRGARANAGSRRFLLRDALAVGHRVFGSGRLEEFATLGGPRRDGIGVLGLLPQPRLTDAASLMTLPAPAGAPLRGEHSQRR